MVDAGETGEAKFKVDARGIEKSGSSVPQEKGIPVQGAVLRMKR